MASDVGGRTASKRAPGCEGVTENLKTAGITALGVRQARGDKRALLDVVRDFDLHWSHINDHDLCVWAGLENIGGREGECTGASALKIVQSSEVSVVHCNRRTSGDGGVDAIGSKVVCSLTAQNMRKVAGRGERKEQTLMPEKKMSSPPLLTLKDLVADASRMLFLEKTRISSLVGLDTTAEITMSSIDVTEDDTA
jgi:hypothetical protein